jgi:hypothetical protein
VVCKKGIMNEMREELIGYLLSALDPHEMRRIELRLTESPELRADLADLEGRLRELDALRAELAGDIEVPQHLVRQTLDRLERVERAPVHAFEVSSPDGRHVSESVSKSGLGLFPELGERQRCGAKQWSDLIAVGLAGGVLVALGLPALGRLREQARSFHCQDNLRQFHSLLAQYASGEPENRVPFVAPSGVEAFAGIYSARLYDRDLLMNERLRLCPTALLTDASHRPAKVAFTDVLSKVPSSEGLFGVEMLKRLKERGEIDRLRHLQVLAGGTYAYALGVMDQGQYKAPQFESRASFAILGDAPTHGVTALSSVDVGKMRWPHPSDAANLLFEDGSVRQVYPASMISLPDHPFMNHRGKSEAGVTIDDASLAPSWKPPFIESVQR